MNDEKYFEFANPLKYSDVSAYLDSLKKVTESQLIVSANAVGELRGDNGEIHDRLSMNISGILFSGGTSVNFSLRRNNSRKSDYSGIDVYLCPELTMIEPVKRLTEAIERFSQGYNPNNTSA